MRECITIAALLIAFTPMIGIVAMAFGFPEIGQDLINVFYIWGWAK